ncbi:MAG: hypothetical protein ACOY16_05595 [Chloroflexota bacterium]
MSWIWLERESAWDWSFTGLGHRLTQELPQVVLYLRHGLECERCRRMVERVREELKEVDVRVQLIVVADPPAVAIGRAEDMFVLRDEQGEVRRRLRMLLDNEPNDVALVVLDRFHVPQRVWIAEEGEDEPLVGELIRWIEYLDFQCPE